jgi:hypothetical protein
MRKLIAAAIALPMLAGCVDVLQQRVSYMNQFVGQSETDLVRNLGVPSRTIESGGRRFLAYVDRRLDVIPSTGLWGPWGFYGPYGGGFPSEVVERSCETTFEIVDSKVQSFTLRGNACG